MRGNGCLIVVAKWSAEDLDLIPGDYWFFLLAAYNLCILCQVLPACILIITVPSILNFPCGCPFMEIPVSAYAYFHRK